MSDLGQSRANIILLNGTLNRLINPCIEEENLYIFLGIFVCMPTVITRISTSRLLFIPQNSSVKSVKYEI